MDVLPWHEIGAGAGWAAFLSLTLLMARAVKTGDWIPRTTHEREIEAVVREMEAVKHDRNEWRTESRIKDAQLSEQATQLRHLGEVGRTVEHAMSALQQAAAIPHPDDKRAS